LRYAGSVISDLYHHPITSAGTDIDLNVTGSRVTHGITDYV
jgi:hypothetical protein